MEEVLIKEDVFMIETIEQLKIVMEPIRLKIMENITIEDELSTKEIAARIGEDSGKMYHHINELTKVGLLEKTKIVMKGNFAIKYYRKSSTLMMLSPKFSETLSNISAAESRSLLNVSLLNFVAHMQNATFEYAKQCRSMTVSAKSGEDERTRAFFSSSVITCNDEEMKQFGGDIADVIRRYKFDEEPGRNHYHVFNVVFRKLEK